MRKNMIISYQFVGTDFRTYHSSFAYGTDTINNDEAATELVEVANEHAESTFGVVYCTKAKANVAITGIFPVYVEPLELPDSSDSKEGTE